MLHPSFQRSQYLTVVTLSNTNQVYMWTYSLEASLSALQKLPHWHIHVCIIHLQSNPCMQLNQHRPPASAPKCHECTVSTFMLTWDLARLVLRPILALEGWIWRE